MPKSTKPWEHAPGSGDDPVAARFVESLSYDTRLYAHDIAGSIAHARMLQHVGLITAGELAAIEKGLNEIKGEIEAAGVTGWSGWKTELEDVHMCIEAALVAKIGDAGRKLHTGRSRNDQVALDLKLWINDATAQLEHKFDALFRAFVELAQRDGRIVMPSYTHLQRAQPILVGGELIAWLTAFDKCLTRFMSLQMVNRDNPLGSGAIAGSSLPLDRQHTAAQLNVGTPSPSSIEATASRDVALDFIYALSMTSMWLSRWAEQWIIYMTSEFGTLKIGDAYTTGSSMMPQKRNPDMLELIRGRCGNVYGNLVAMLTICKGLPIGYNRDLQEDKRHVFAAYDTVGDALDMAAQIVKSAKFKQPDLSRGFMDATTLAEYFVTKGVPFRTAHQMVGKLVTLCEELKHTQLSELSLKDFQNACDKTGKDVFDWLGAANVVKRYQTAGNAGVSGFEAQLAEWKQRLSGSSSAGGGREGVRASSSAATRSSAPSPSPSRREGSNALFETSPDAHDQTLIDAYKKQGRTLDDLPYTDEFETICQTAGNGRDRREVFARLHNLRKAGKLPTGLKALEKAPKVTPKQTKLLEQLVTHAVGKLSLRDQLPFTPKFDEIVQRFNADAQLNFSAYQVWRVIAKLAK